jgi:hypothetical protein
VSHIRCAGTLRERELPMREDGTSQPVGHAVAVTRTRCRRTQRDGWAMDRPINSLMAPNTPPDHHAWRRHRAPMSDHHDERRTPNEGFAQIPMGAADEGSLRLARHHETRARPIRHAAEQALRGRQWPAPWNGLSHLRPEITIVSTILGGRYQASAFAPEPGAAHVRIPADRQWSPLAHLQVCNRR